MSISASKIVIKSIPAVRVIALREVIDNYRAQKPLWTKLCGFADQHSLAITGPCFSIYYDPGYKAKDVDIEICLPIAEDADVPDVAAKAQNITSRVLPELPKAASIIHEGTYDTIPPVYEALYTWINKEKLQPNGPVREVYVKMDPNDTTEQSFVTELQQSLA